MTVVFLVVLLLFRGVMHIIKCATSLLGTSSYLIWCLCVIMWIPSRTLHPYAIPEVLSFPVEDGNQAYMKWMDEAIPDDWCVVLKQTSKRSVDKVTRWGACVCVHALACNAGFSFNRFILFGCSDLFTVNSLSGIDVRFHSLTEIVTINREQMEHLDLLSLLELVHNKICNNITSDM